MDQLPSDTLASKRQACDFGAGALTESTLGISAATAATIPIRHVLIVMKENRSFDHLLGALHDEAAKRLTELQAGARTSLVRERASLRKPPAQ